MKHYRLAFAFATIVGMLHVFDSVAYAGLLPPNYFRALGPDNYHLYDGALFSSKGGLGATQNTTVLAIFTHSPKDGSLLPQYWVDNGYAEAWTPFVLGGSEGGGNATINFGPLANFGPLFQSAILNGLNALAPTAFPNAKSFLISQKESGKADITFSFGVMLNAALVQNGHFVNIKTAFADPVRYFAGPALHF